MNSEIYTDVNGLQVDLTAAMAAGQSGISIVPIRQLKAVLNIIYCNGREQPQTQGVWLKH
jgi:hypothetical protein